MAFKIEKHPDRVRIFGTLGNHSYGVEVHPVSKETAWVDPLPAAPVPPAPEMGPGEECKGCGKGVLQKLAEGGLGVAKALGTFVGVGTLDPEVVSMRDGQCSGCPTAQNNCGICERCHCLIALKIRVGSEKCPDGHWSEHAD